MPEDSRLSKEDNKRFDEEARRLRALQGEKWYVKLKTYFALSGPGWLQSALTLGGGSLASGLYLGVLTGVSMLWLQPLAMLLGIIMLSALGLVTLATDQRPFYAINEHINPVLGWGWALGSILACMVWVMPQFSLANGVVQQNLLPGIFGPGSVFGDFGSMLFISVLALAITLGMTWNYGGGSRGVTIFEMILKGLVAIVVLSFIGVVVRLTIAGNAIDWGEVFAGFIPNPALIFRPAEGFLPLLNELPEISAQYWSELIVSRQQEVMAAALSSAVGINATFLFAYSMLRRKWGTEYKGMMKFDLIAGMLLPFMLATSCVVIAGASQFHTVPQPGFLENDQSVQWEPNEQQVSEYNRLLEGRVLHEAGGTGALSDEQIASQVEQLGDTEQRMAATLVTRDAFDLALSLQPLLGGAFSNIIFGIGVFAMALSTITIHMVICGFVVCEIMKVPYDSWHFRAGIMIPSVGVLGPFFWDQALFWLAIPTSVVTLMLLPIAYVTFFLMLNSKAIMKEHKPTGRRRVIWNTLMILSIVLIGTASIYMLWQYGGIWGLTALLLFLGAAVVVEWKKRTKSSPLRS
ncbi:Natural resistance-associated macrophage protein [Fodinibius roseus]|uniref:Natural resistance-associated macrophage protein n=1 Tax=Fodinibius roseus TaxID=1194090 RepID=A0A1M4TP06_9BACT|nr:divalent metal cation transporter [Fodinibius roseus]SHE46125.1 Natural resistance-associated macrophage protein [Fodinibius roseus]